VPSATEIGNSAAQAADAKVDALRQISAYPENPTGIAVLETHMSWVFLTDRHAYKLKKPVRYEFLDFSTIEARRQNCEREVELNRRLAADVYYAAVPLTLGSGGKLNVGGGGPIVDWLVKMRRLPAHRMLDAAIRANTVGPEDIRRLSRVLADFYRGLVPIALDAAEYRYRFEKNIRDNQAELGKPHYELPGPLVQRLAAAQRSFIHKRGDLLERRARESKIVEGHGDLRPEHICLTAEPKIIDCLEFNREFRLVDPADELAYLSMECERLGAGAIGNEILRQYLAAAGDTVPDELARFYKTFRACLRAKIAIWHIADHDVRDTEKWRARANDYLRLAESYAVRLR
jgi:aminoglycoside phosphotransferase family enzyme